VSVCHLSLLHVACMHAISTITSQNTLSTGHALLFTFGVLLVVDAPLATRISAPHVCNLAGRASVLNLRTTKRSAPHACKLQLVNAKHQQRPSGWLLERKKHSKDQGKWSCKLLFIGRKPFHACKIIVHIHIHIYIYI
jgi:hypothetical protein